MGRDTDHKPFIKSRGNPISTMTNSARKTIAIVSITLLALLALLLVLLSWTIGNAARVSMLESVQMRLPPQSRDRIRIQEISYQQGVFTSNAQYQLEFGPVGESAMPGTQLQARIQHGPLLFTNSGVEIGAARVLIEPKDISKAMSQPLIVEMTVGFDQQVDLSLQIEAFEQLDGRNQVQLNASSASASILQDQSADFRLNMGQLRLNNPNADLTFSMDSLHIESRTKRLNDLAAPSSVKLRIPGMESSGAINFQLSDLLIATEVTESEQDTTRIDFTQQLSINDLDSSWPLQSLDWSLDFDRMPAALVRDYTNMARELQGRIERGQPVDAAMTQSALMLGLRLLNSDFRIQQTIALNAHDGEHESALLIRYNGLPELTNLAYLDLNELIAALEVELTLSLDLDAVLRSSSANLIDPYVQAGYITVENGRILLQSSLLNSEWILNGEPRSIEEFF